MIPLADRLGSCGPTYVTGHRRMRPVPRAAATPVPPPAAGSATFAAAISPLRPRERGQAVFLLIAHFDLDAERTAEQALLDAAEPVRLLAEQPDTHWLRWGRSTEDGRRLLLVAEFDTAAGYRRAQSPLDVRTALIPWLSTAEIRNVRCLRGAGGR